MLSSRHPDTVGYAHVTAVPVYCSWFQMLEPHIGCVLSKAYPAPCCTLSRVQYPLLTAHHKRIAELPGVKEYLASPQRLEKANYNGIG